MFFRRFVFVFLLCITLAVATQSAPVQSSPVQRGLIETASVDWPSYNNDISSDRYVRIAQINTSNVSGLHVVCSTQLGLQQAFQTGPIVVGGVLYATTSNQTIAVNAATCSTLWVNTYVLPKGVSHTNRGAAFAGGRLYRGFADGHVIAIDATSGTTVWNQSVIGTGSLEFIAGAPIVWNASVIIGTANGEYGQMCHVVALDQTSGAILWSEQTVPNLGDPAAKTWKGASHIAGGATWTSFTIDPATGKLYVPIGNPGPDYDTRKRVGSNLYTDSVLELDSATGTLERAMQLIPRDDHDWDQSATPALITLKNGTKIALTAGKDGYLRSVDINTFSQRWQTPVTTIANATAPIVVKGTHFCPSGSVYWNGPAYSPATGLAYVNAVDWCKTVALEPTPAPFVPGQSWLGSSDGDGVKDATKSGWLSAVNATTGAVLWTYHSTLPLVAGVTPTSGGLVFTADLNGNILAFNATTGALLQTISTRLPVGGGVISYAVSGTQYVAVAAGMYSGNFQTPKVNSSIVILGI